MAKQIMFMGNYSLHIHGGIQLDNEDVICGCCGTRFEKSNLDDEMTILKVYDHWVDLTEEIYRDDYTEGE